MKTINAHELKKLLGDNKVTLIDVREISEYNSEHIPQAYLIPLDEVSVDKIPSKDKPILIH